MGMAQGTQLGEMATTQATQEAAFGETGRQNWLTSLMNLSTQKPQVASYTPSATTTGTQTTYAPSQGMFGPLMGMGGSLIGQNMQQNWLTSLLGSMGGGGSSGGSGFELPSNISDEPDWASIGLSAAQALPAIASMFSSIELKENVKELETPLEKVKKLKGVKFDWIVNKENSGGVIAEEVEKVMPEAVTEIDGIKAIKPMVIIAYLIEAVKELSERK